MSHVPAQRPLSLFWLPAGNKGQPAKGPKFSLGGLESRLPQNPPRHSGLLPAGDHPAPTPHPRETRNSLGFRVQALPRIPSVTTYSTVPRLERLAL